ncbi:GFA family protein [filamentous cyanobacterium LEGE 11480]|uniref:GFA family protein n=1 Tax=Romeriopsis navalis LEGE 11480 TaxID=2777977 RepID=A0A928Z184_9CYAN|nr:GFA family protein [Romeriopsis navalis LEGE 11480]
MVEKLDTLSELEGGCVCGAVRFTATALPLRITICHCTWCQRRTGTAFGTECVFPVEQVRVEGGPLRSYRHISDISGRWIEQDFCSSCGSNIGLRLEALSDIRSISIGCFDSHAWMDGAEIPVRHVFTRSKLPLSEIPDNVEAYEMHFRS